MGKTRPFQSDLKIMKYSRNVDIFGQKTSFSKRSKSRRYGQETIFKSNLKENVLYLEILIFSDIWAKNDIFKVISK